MTEEITTKKFEEYFLGGGTPPISPGTQEGALPFYYFDDGLPEPESVDVSPVEAVGPVAIRQPVEGEMDYFGWENLPSQLQAMYPQETQAEAEVARVKYGPATKALYGIPVEEMNFGQRILAGASRWVEKIQNIAVNTWELSKGNIAKTLLATGLELGKDLLFGPQMALKKYMGFFTRVSDEEWGPGIGYATTPRMAWTKAASGELVEYLSEEPLTLAEGETPREFRQRVQRSRELAPWQKAGYKDQLRDWRVGNLQRKRMGLEALPKPERPTPGGIPESVLQRARDLEESIQAEVAAEEQKGVTKAEAQRQVVRAHTSEQLKGQWALLKKMPGELLDAWAKGEQPEWGGDFDEHWRRASGWRATHALIPETAERFEELVDSGVPVQQAARATEDPVKELIWDLIMDPNWFLGFDRLAFKAAGRVLGTGKKVATLAAKGTGLRIPVVGKALDWVFSMSAQTVGNRAYRATIKAIDRAQRFVPEGSVDDVLKLASEPTEDFIKILPSTARRDFMIAGRHLPDVIGDVVKKAGGDLGKATEDAATRAYYAAFSKTVSDNPELVKWVTKRMARNRLLRGVRSIPGFLYESWLGVRPSWNVYNYIDNTVKLILDGVSPWSKLRPMVKRYANSYGAKYLTSDELIKLGKQVDAEPFWRLSPARATQHADALITAMPEGAVGSFMGADVFRARQGFYSLSDIPVVGKPIGKFMERNRSLARVIEADAGTRLWLKNFNETMGDGWKKILNRPMSLKVGEETLDLSLETAKAIRSQLIRMRDPTSEGVQAIGKSFLGIDELRRVTLNDGIFANPSPLPDEFVYKWTPIIDALSDTGPVYKQAVQDTFENKMRRDLMDAFHQDLYRARGVYQDALPKVAPTIESFTDEILGKPIQEATLEELYRATNDLGLYHVSYSNVAHARREEIFEQAAKLKGKARRKLLDDYLTVERPKFWEGYLQAEESFVRQVADAADELVPSGGRLFPREDMERLIHSTRRQQELYTLGARERARIVNERVGQPINSPGKLMMLGELEATSPYFEEAVRHGSEIDIAKRRLLDWFEGLDLDKAGREGLQPFRWYEIEDNLAHIRSSVVDQFDPMFKRLREWEDFVLQKRVVPVETIPLSAADKELMPRFFDQLTENVRSLISDAENFATRRRNRVLGDYLNTSNLQKLLGNFIPFVRWPAYNLPYWIGKFADAPMLYSSMSKIRRFQETVAEKEGIKGSQKYSVPLFRFPDTKMFEALGLANTRLRLPVWSYLSWNQAFPGTTPFRRQQFQEALEAGSQWDILYETASQVGLGLWPWWEWPLGMQGLLGDNWYPRDVIGGWVPLMRWTMNQVFHYDPANLEQRKKWGLAVEAVADPDRFIRARLPSFWNATVGSVNPRWKWEHLNPDNMLDWATGQETERILVNRESELRTALEGAATEEERGAIESDLHNVAFTQALRKRMLSTVVGHMTGAYLQFETDEANYAQELRKTKRARQEALGVGEEYRDFERQFREEHWLYGAIQKLRFQQYPWAETAAKTEFEGWDAYTDSQESRYWDYNTRWWAKLEEVTNEIGHKFPGDKWRLRNAASEMRVQKTAYREARNAEVKAELTKRMEAYIETHPDDVRGIELLREGYDAPQYVSPHLPDEVIEKLRAHKDKHTDDFGNWDSPDSKVAYDIMVSEYWSEVRKGTPIPKQMVHFSGLDEGIEMDLSWSPNSRTEEEVWDRLKGDVYYQLSSNRPQREDFEIIGEYYDARQDYMDNLTQHAMELPDVQRQIAALVQRGIPEKEATKAVEAWYTQEELERYWRRNDTIQEALLQAYEETYIHPADELWEDEIKPIKAGDYDLYGALREDFFQRYKPISADKLISAVMEMYPDKWTIKELDEAYRGITLPGIQDYWRLRSTGRSAIRSYINFFYYRLERDARQKVLEAFGTPFTDMFLKGNDKDLSIELLGDWLTTLSAMVTGKPMDWHQLPYVEEESAKSGSLKEARDFGLPYVGPPDMQEFEAARKLNQAHWQARAAGNTEVVDAIRRNPLWIKWFATVPSSIFWDNYYSDIPPGWVSKELRDHPIMKMVLDKNIRNTVGDTRDYNRAIELMENWLMLNSQELFSMGFDPEEYDEVRELSKQYWAIPKEKKDERKAFLKNSPLLQKYLFEPKKAVSRATSGSGGARARSTTASRANLTNVWSNARTASGGKFNYTVRTLSEWKRAGGKLSPAKLNYLRSIYEKTGSDLDFEAWLELFWQALLAFRVSSTTGTGVRVPSKPRLPPRGRPQRVARGRRQF